MTEEQEGILGNLPRSRPGRRSEKRSGPAARSTRAGAAGTPKRSPGPPPKPPNRQTSGGGDPLELALTAATGVAEAGVKAASRLAGGIVRRLPRI